MLYLLKWLLNIQIGLFATPCKDIFEQASRDRGKSQENQVVDNLIPSSDGFVFSYYNHRFHAAMGV